MIYLVGEYAWPGLNAVLYAIAFSVIIFSVAGVRSMLRDSKAYAEGQKKHK